MEKNITNNFIFLNVRVQLLHHVVAFHDKRRKTNNCFAGSCNCNDCFKMPLYLLLVVDAIRLLCFVTKFELHGIGYSWWNFNKIVRVYCTVVVVANRDAKNHRARTPHGHRPGFAAMRTQQLALDSFARNSWRGLNLVL